jgi:hypothetical protein
MSWGRHLEGAAATTMVSLMLDPFYADLLECEGR